MEQAAPHYYGHVNNRCPGAEDCRKTLIFSGNWRCGRGRMGGKLIVDDL
jgi:hypothetical protein